MEKIILITKTRKKDGGFQARVFGKNPALQTFAKTEIEALEHLVEKLKGRNPKHIM